MRNLFVLVFVISVIIHHSNAQSTESLHGLFSTFYQSTKSSNTSKLDGVWNELVDKGLIPYTENDSVLFLYRGEASSVSWMGDFNGWGSDRSFHNVGKRIPGSDIWYLKASFHEDSRLDYKIILNGKSWILDPGNRRQQWSGVGGGSLNSELRMSGYKEDSVLSVRPGVPEGQVISDLLFHSHSLEYQITYSIYLPAEVTSKLPVIYVTDGYEYMHPKMGNMPTILNNLIAEKKIKPLIAVFIDHRDPGNRTNNRRMQELTMNPKYLDFFTNEFIPFIESKYPIQGDKNHRAILGASQGGLNATYFLFSKPDVFGFAGIQSPTFWNRPQIYKLCEEPKDTSVVISMTSGTVNDASESSRKMTAILEANSCVYHYREVNEGSSWGNWRNLIDDILLDFFAFK